MPGWYVHLEAAHDTARRLRDGSVPSDFPITPADAQIIGQHCHTWRNYLALGSLGPDLFFLLPDFKNTTGQVIRRVVEWALDVWGVIDSVFVGKWETWIGPIETNNAQLASQLTGGLSAQLAQVLDELSSAVLSAFKGLLAQAGDWFGVLSSGVPQGYGADAFYWSDMFHYRRTYQFPFVLFQQAQGALAAATTEGERQDAEARVAFAVGWMSHCATDVTGHPFTNAKSGGPYRDHWQRHHLVENHMDSENYGARHAGSLYAEYGTSALHFRLAFRHREDPPYNGRDDAPAYDYWAGFPAYDNADGPSATAQRHTFFDVDTGPLPDHLAEGLLDAMRDVYGADSPHILLQDPIFSAADPVTGQPDGRPNERALAEMWEVVYRYLKLTSSDAISLRLPPPPSVFTDHSFPTPPAGSGSWLDDDPSRGADVVDDDSFALLDLLLAVFAAAAYVAQVVVWLVTILPSLIVDLLTFPAREVVYWAVVAPAWDLYLLARRALVMSGFAMPKPTEISTGLTTLGREGPYDIASALDDPNGVPTGAPEITEPSGRLRSTDARGIDHAYPRGIVRDLPSAISRPDLVDALGFTSPLRYAADPPSPWRPTSAVGYAVVAAGFLYDPDQDIIYSSMDPQQRRFGFAFGYDAYAFGISSVIDCEPIFFDYDGRHWMIELWKGQYGLETGCEIGVYTRPIGSTGIGYTLLDDTIGPRPGDQAPSHNLFYDCATNADRLELSATLRREGAVLFTRGPEMHWWLTGFKWGVLSDPRQLAVDVAITLKDHAMRDAFLAAVASRPYSSVAVNGTTVSFTFDQPFAVPQPTVPAPILEQIKANNHAIVRTYNAQGLATNDPNHVQDEFLDGAGLGILHRADYFGLTVSQLAIDRGESPLSVVTALADGFGVSGSTVEGWLNGESPLFPTWVNESEKYRGGPLDFKPSEWIAPWRYPLTNQAGTGVAQEGAATHVGPYVVGSNSTVLLSELTGDNDARRDLEKASTPAATEEVLNVRLPADQHLGGPVDYGLYLVGRMAAEVGNPEFGVPDFNLDSDRGYAWRCWDWDRSSVPCRPDIIPVGGEDYSYSLPCTSPQFFHADHDCPSQPGRWYDEAHDLAVHYLPGSGPEECFPPHEHRPETDPTWRKRLDQEKA